MNKTQELRTYLNQQRGRQLQIEKSVSELRSRSKETGREIRRYEQAREIIRSVGLKTQEELQYHIGDITSLALETVLDDPYELVAEFVQRRNKTECDLLFLRNGERSDPIGSSGGGAVDVAAFALRIASWSMARPRTRNTIILDEPMRFLSQDMQERASRMIKELSERLGLQFIIITHETTLAEFADKTFTTRIRKGKTKIIT
jgi:DNA repair exonuclease SbcCD ATPase subunit